MATLPNAGPKLHVGRVLRYLKDGNTVQMVKEDQVLIPFVINIQGKAVGLIGWLRVDWLDGPSDWWRHRPLHPELGRYSTVAVPLDRHGYRYNL